MLMCLQYYVTSTDLNNIISLPQLTAGHRPLQMLADWFDTYFLHEYTRITGFFL